MGGWGGYLDVCINSYIMYVCMYVCTDVCMYGCMYAGMYVFVYVSASTYLHLRKTFKKQRIAMQKLFATSRRPPESLTSCIVEL